METSAQAQISCNNMGKHFPVNGDLLRVYEGINFDVQPGEFVCVVGPSGCGKTTLLRTIAGLEAQSVGEMHVAAADSTEKPHIGMVFQEHGLFPWMTVHDNLAFILSNDSRYSSDDVNSIVGSLLSKVGLEKFADYYPHQLSGGMKQRVSIARGFATAPPILLMDEPFVFLDFQTRLHLHELLLHLWQTEQKTIVFVTHDIEEAVLLADRVFVMTARPGTIKDELFIKLDRPRDLFAVRHTAEFLNCVEYISQQLRDELKKAGLE